MTLPPIGCEYLSPSDVHEIINGLPPGTTIEFAPIHTDFICRGGEQGGCPIPLPPGTCEASGGPLGGNADCFDSTLSMDLTGTGSLAGFTHHVDLQVQCTVATGPRTSGQPTQVFPNEMFNLQSMPHSDGVFSQLLITAGQNNGLPASTGQTTLTQLGGGQWQVDSFFDITYRIDFVGAPGGPLAGQSGSTTGTIHMEVQGGSSDPIEACCQTSGCVELTAAQCAASGGTPQGVGTTCGPTSCQPTVITIPAGGDCWQTTCGTTQFDFCTTPIPADFFGPGSLPFEGVVLLGGATTGADTVVTRLSGANLPDNGSTATIPIQLTQLDLVSCAPIVVMISDVPTQWSVAVDLSSVSSPPGAMTVERTHDNGGTFHSAFPVQPRFTFTRIDQPTDVRVLDLGEEGHPPALFQTIGDAPWVSTLTIPASTCGTGFHPGVEEDTGTGSQCCKLVGHSAGSPPGHIHATAPPDCSGCPTGACCDPATGACTIVSPSGPNTAGDVCAASGGTYGGDGSTCADSDGDGLPDFIETNDCRPCPPAPPLDACHTGTDPNNPDSDGDGCPDGAEIAGGTNPCNPCSASAGCLAPDCNSNGSSDACDISSGASTDTNTNGIPDDCEPSIGPCGQCGPGPHWVDTCTGGDDTMGTGALIGIDTDLDGLADTTLVLTGPASVSRTASADDSSNYPGLRTVDGHLDVIDTEMISMSLTGGGVTLVAGAGNGQGNVLSATLGAIAEQSGNASLADSFFDVFVEIDLGGGSFVYNQTPLRVTSKITCVPPQASYFHPRGILIPLYSAPTGGVLVANLVEARHDSFPTPAGCCMPDGTCADMLARDCVTAGGKPQPIGWNCLGDADSNGVDDICECGPEADGSACRDFPCAAGQQCQPKCVRFTPGGSGDLTILDCDCGGSDDCHVDLTGPATGGGMRSANPCEVPDNGGGTVTLPPAGCAYLSPDDVHRIVDGLPPGTTIEFGAIHTEFICNRQPGGSSVCSFPTTVDCDEAGGSLGGTQECSDSTLAMNLQGTGSLSSLVRSVTIPVSFETHTGPRTPGDPVQSFDTDMFRLFGQITGDPDFDLLRVTGGTDFGLPSPGHTTLTLLPGGDWAVDSFFDITYRIDFVGAAGGPLAGMSGSTTGTIRMGTGLGLTPTCAGNCPAGTTCVQTRTSNPDGTVDLCCNCETDCNSNGVPDSTDISSGGSLDCNTNGIPDECDIASGASTDSNGNGIPDECEPQDCLPNPAGDGCQSVTCPNGDDCVPVCVTYDAATGQSTVTQCECRGATDCHIEFETVTTGARSGSNPCEVLDNGSGTVTLPPAGCDYLSPDDVHAILDGLPAGTTIEFAPIHTNFICNRNGTAGGGGGSCDPGAPWGVDCTAVGGSLGGERECSDSDLQVTLDGTGTLNGSSLDGRTLTIPVSFETHTGPRTPGDPVQSFDTDMFRLFGEITGDPDFDLLRVTGGTDFGLPSPGHTTLTRLPSGNWAVDSFFDITYRIDFVGAAGGPLAGMSGSTTATIRMATGHATPKCAGSCPAGHECELSRVVNPDGTYTLCCQCAPVNDCNTNGIDDATDISSGASRDCNTNGVPDECDIAAGTSRDINRNGKPDECELVARIRVAKALASGARAAGDCLDPGSGTNDTLTVKIEMTDASAVVVAGQFFLEYDNSVLDFISAAPGDAPFVREVYEDVNEAAGTIDYVTGIEDFTSGTTADTVMAVLTFQVISEDCSSTAIVAFRDHDPPSRLGGEADSDVEAVTVNLTPFTIDGTPPVVTAPADITASAEAGSCSVTFGTLPLATATDNCDPDVTITFSRSDSKPNLLDAYDAADSPITITWTGEDDCGNTATATQTITIDASNEIVVDVELSPTLDDTSLGSGDVLTRCIRFELWTCPSAAPAETIDVPVSFPVDGPPHRATGVTLTVECGDYTCITARDRLHTLRSTAPDFTNNGSNYTASFVGNRDTGGHWLVGGNLNDDHYIDVLDFSSYVVRTGTNYGTGDTTCSTPFFHADITGDGKVLGGDFTFIRLNFLDRHEANCCGAPRSGDPEAAGPITDITVAELWRRGLGELAAADLNHDGRVNADDMAAYQATGGVQPGDPSIKGRRTPLAPAAGQPKQRR